MACRSEKDFAMYDIHNAQEEQWMALPLYSQAAPANSSGDISIWSHHQPLAVQPPQCFIDPSSHNGQLEAPAQWALDASTLGHTLDPSTPWIVDPSSPNEYTAPPIPWRIDSPSLEDPTTASIPWTADTSGPKGFPELQIQSPPGPPLLDSPLSPTTPSFPRTPGMPTVPPSHEERNISRPGSNSRWKDSPPELLLDHPTSPSHAECPVAGYNKPTVRFAPPQDFRRRDRQHVKRFFCRYKNCLQSEPDSPSFKKRGFTTRKDRDRHEARHKPEIRCQWRNEQGEQCTRLFSRMDNMRDHVRRIHRPRF
ncbi:hypothetical protein BDV26DRAFT_304956 [Aspergillus bertholletiae]|uniref:Uncharacterized protein n=1 Tax=Aspergillus bertholletiae TaxID=1226010 RepID=A0A5N7B770_9EURO|nr:hypothetical protein BDV26DRAFT_304956 [Aspergillus bertholletiae]